MMADRTDDLQERLRHVQGLLSLNNLGGPPLEDHLRAWYEKTLPETIRPAATDMLLLCLMRAGIPDDRIVSAAKEEIYRIPEGTYLSLFHGRNYPEEKLEDWGFQGPLVGGIESMHITYFTTFRITFVSTTAQQKAILLTGWEAWDGLSVEMRIDNDLVRVEAEGSRPAWYGDWSLVVAPPQ